MIPSPSVTVVYNAYTIIIGVVLGVGGALVLGLIAFFVLKSRKAPSGSSAINMQAKV